MKNKNIISFILFFTLISAIICDIYCQHPVHSGMVENTICHHNTYIEEIQNISEIHPLKSILIGDYLHLIIRNLIINFILIGI